MIGKFFTPSEEEGGEQTDRLGQLSSWRMRSAARDQKKQLQRRLFGEHYNYSKIGLNKEKKYLIQEQKNTEIERSNRILLEKIQSISKRSVPIGMKKRAFTQQTEADQLAPIGSRPALPTKNVDRSGFASHNQLSKHDISLKTPRGDRKMLHRGIKQINGKQFQFKIYVQKDRYVLLAQYQNYRQQIRISLQNYRQLLKDQLQGEHTKILQLLTYNGTLLELTGVKKQQIIIEEKDEVSLPQIAPHHATESETRRLQAESSHH